MKRTLRIVAWVVELAGCGLLIWAAFRVAPELGAAVAGVMLLGLGFAIYDE